MMVARRQTDWYSWLRRTGLHPSLVQEYSLLFSRNELDEGDLHHFDHPFLHSLGVTVAKHRLQILKLARTDRPSLLLRLLSSALGKTRRRIAEMLRRPRRNGEEEEPLGSTQLAVLRRSASSGHPRPPGLARVAAYVARQRSCGEPPGSRSLCENGKKAAAAATVAAAEEEEAEEEISWDSLFRDMKPT